MKTLQAFLAHRSEIRLRPAIWIALLALVLAALACDLPATPYDVYVATTGNDGNDCRSAAHACLTITAALDKAVTASVIHVGAGTFTTSTGISVNKFVTIQGAGQTHTFVTRSDARGVNLVIGDVYTAITATVNDLTLTGGNEGLATWVANSHLTGNNLTVQTPGGTAISNFAGARMDLTNVTVSNSNLGIGNNGVLNGNHLVIQGSQQYGIYNAGAITLQNATIQNNALTIGMGIINGGTPGHPARFTLTHGTISGNHYAGLNNQAGSTAELTSTLVGPNPRDGLDNDGSLVLTGVEVEGNGFNGVQSNHDSSLKVIGSSFVNNTNLGIGLGDVSGGASADITNSTFSGNHAGGLFGSDSQIQLSYVTIASNPGQGLGGGGNTIALDNSIVALNGAPNCQNNSGSINQTGTNRACDDTLTNTSLRLGPLTLLTGTRMIPLLAGSSAIDHASSACPPTDQRGYRRPHGSACDIGAYEFGAVLALEAATPGTESPTETPGVLTILPSDTPTPALLEIVTDTPTPTAAAPAQVLLSKNGNCRKGPGTHYDVVTSYAQGQAVTPKARNSAGTWLVISAANNPDCWTDAGNLTPAGPWDQLSVLPDPPLPDAPATFQDAPVCTPKPPSLVVTLTWPDVSNESGYHLYLNNQALADLGANVTKYVYKLSKASTGLTFQLQAFNANGVSDTLTTTVSACP